MWDNKVFLASLRFCDGISLFLITISPKNNMTNSTASNSTQQLTIYTLSKIIYSSVSDLNVQVVGHDCKKEKRKSEMPYLSFFFFFLWIYI